MTHAKALALCVTFGSEIVPTRNQIDEAPNTAPHIQAQGTFTAHIGASVLRTSSSREYQASRTHVVGRLRAT